MQKEARKKSVLVIGDLMLDEYVIGDCERVSPEAPVPVVVYKTTKTELGGALNVVNSINILGGTVFPLGVIGDDSNGQEILNILSEKNITDEWVIRSRYTITTTKTRIFSNNQQITRVDFEDNWKERPEGGIIENDINTALKRFLTSNEPDLIIISDYDKGVINKSVVTTLANYKNSINKNGKNTIIIASPKKNLYDEYRGIKSLVMNSKELAYFSNSKINYLEDLVASGDALIKATGVETMVITRGELGLVLFVSKNSSSIKDIPTKNIIIDDTGCIEELPFEAHYSQYYAIRSKSRNPISVIGAGDTVLATFSLAVAFDVDLVKAAILSNDMAGKSVEGFGTCTAYLEEILAN